MQSPYLLILIALLFCFIAIKLLVRAIVSSQYDYLDKESWRILAEEETSSEARVEAHAPAEEKLS